MFECQVCHATFLNSDEFTSHMQKHTFELFERAEELIKTGQWTEFIKQFAEHLADILEHRLNPPVKIMPPMPVIVEKEYSFEEIQLAIAIVQSGKSVNEFFNIANDVKRRLRRKHGIRTKQKLAKLSTLPEVW